MAHQQSVFRLKTSGPGLYEFTRDVEQLVSQSGIETGLLTLFCRHTSCSLVIQENADPDVQRDLSEFFSRLAPEDMDWVTHTLEGPDDMPAHIKSTLTQVSLGIPIMSGHPALGTWQGVYLFEHRKQVHQREVIVHLSGD